MTYQSILYQIFFWRGLYFASAFLLNILFARFYQASESGLVFYVTNSYAFTLLVAGLSLETGMVYFISKKVMATAKLLNLALIWSFVTCLIILIYLSFNTWQNKYADEIFIMFSLSYICGVLLTNYCSGLFYGNKNFQTPSIICTGCNLVLMLLIFISFNYPSSFFNTQNFLSVYFCMFLVQGLVMVLSVKATYSPTWKPMFLSSPEIKKLLRYSLTALIANVVYFLAYRADYWFVKAFCSPNDLGNYIQVSKLGQVLVTIPSIMSSAVFTITASSEATEINEGLKVLTRMLVLASGIFCVMIALAGKWLFPLIFGPSFSHMYLPFLLLIPGILSLSALSPLAAFYGGKNLIRVNITSSLIALLFIITADIIFIPPFGIEAAALISSIGYMLCYLYELFFFKREYKTSVAGFFKVKKSDFLLITNFVLKKGR